MLILCNTRYLAVFKSCLEDSPLSQPMFPCISQDIASLCEHLPEEIIPDTSISRLLSHNSRPLFKWIMFGSTRSKGVLELYGMVEWTRQW